MGKKCEKKIEEDLDLIISEDVLRNNREKELKKDKLNKKQNNRKKVVFTMIIILSLLTLMLINKEIQNKAIEGCLNNGYDESYCIRHS